MPFAELSTGARLHYEHLNSRTDQTPILALHGLLGTGRKDLGHVLDWLAAKGYEVIAPSLRGYGESTPKPRDFPYRFYHRDAEDVLTFMQTLNLEQVHLLGYSDGGEVALVCAGQESTRFKTVTTIGSVGYMGPDVRPVIMNYRPGSEWITPQEIEMHQIPDADAFSAQWVRSMVMQIDSGGDVAVSVASRLNMPLLMMLGTHDKLNPRRYADQFIASGVPDGRVMMFDCGHAIHDQQTELFQKAFLEHIKDDK